MHIFVERIYDFYVLSWKCYTMVNMFAKLDQEAPNGLVAIVFTSLFPYIIFVNYDLDL